MRVFEYIFVILISGFILIYADHALAQESNVTTTSYEEAKRKQLIVNKYTSGVFSSQATRSSRNNGKSNQIVAPFVFSKYTAPSGRSGLVRTGGNRYSGQSARGNGYSLSMTPEQVRQKRASYSTK